MHNAPSSTDVDQLRSLLELLSYYNRFLPQLTSHSATQSAVKGLTTLEVDGGKGTSFPCCEAVAVIVSGFDAFQS